MVSVGRGGVERLVGPRLVVAGEQDLVSAHSLEPGQVRRHRWLDPLVHADAQGTSHYDARSADHRRPHQLLGQYIQQRHRALQKVQ